MSTLDCYEGFTIEIPPVVDGCVDMRAVSFGRLFSLLSLEHIVTMIRALLLDCRVEVCGTDLSDVSMVVLGMIALIDPFEYRYSVIPILRNDKDAIDTIASGPPGAYFVGRWYCKSERHSYESFDSDVVVDIGSKEMKIRSDKTDWLPKFPGYERTLSNMKEILKNGRPKEDMTTEQIERLHLAWQDSFRILLSEEFSDFIVRDECNSRAVWNTELFLKFVPEEESAFFRQFMQTDCFVSYQENQIKNYISSI
jgi:hypothetical protein